MKTNAIEKLKSRITDNLTYPPQTDEGYLDSKRKVTKCVRSIKKQLNETMFEMHDNEQIIRYITHCQKVLIHCCNLVTRNLSQQQSEEQNLLLQNSKLVDLHSIIYRELDELLEYCERYFLGHFNLCVEIAECKKTKTQLEFMTTIKSLQCQQVCELKNIALKPIEAFTNSKQSITYKKFYYLQGLANEVQKHCGQCKEIRFDCSLKKSLILNNYNSNYFFNQQTRTITERLAKKDTFKEQKLYVLIVLKKLRQIPSNTSISFNAESSPIKLQLITWLEEELFFLDKKITDNLFIPKTIPPEETNKSNKVILPSVECIGKFARCFYETKTMRHTEVKDYIQFFSDNFKTDNIEVVSNNSVRNSYYDKDSESWESIKGELIKMLNYVNDQIKNPY